MTQTTGEDALNRTVWAGKIENDGVEIRVKKP